MDKLKLSRPQLLTLVVVFAALAWSFPESIVFFACSFAAGAVLLLLSRTVIGALLGPAAALQEAFLRDNGFSPCTPEEAAALHVLVGRLKAWRSPDGFRLGDPFRAMFRGQPAFQYAFSDAGRTPGGVSSATSRGEVRSFELIVPFPRRSAARVHIILGKDDTLGKVVRAHAETLDPLIARRWSSEAHPVEGVRLPPTLVERGLSTVLGPPGSTLEDLLAPEEIEAVLGLAAAGVEHLVAHDGVALLCFRGGYVTKEGYALLPGCFAKLDAPRVAPAVPQA